MLVQQRTTEISKQGWLRVLGVSKSECHVSLAILVSEIGMCVVTGVYIPPVRAGFTTGKYVKIWDKMVEFMHSL